VIATPGVDATSDSDVGLTPETAYCYRVLAYNENGDSPWSNESCAITGAAPVLPPAPDVPTDGLRVRLIASDLDSQQGDGSGVGNWPNRGSDGDATQADAARLPTFHLNSGLFDGTPYVGFNEGSDNDEALEIFGVVDHESSTLIAVVRQEDASGHSYGLFGTWASASNRTGFVTYRSATPNRISYWDPSNSWKDAGVTIAAGDEHIIVWRVAGGSAVDFQIDGAGAGSVAMSLPMRTPFDRYVIGMTEPTTASRFDGQVAELMFYDRALLACERDGIVADLGAQYGIAVSVTGGECVPPAAPAALNTTAVNYRQIDLTWTDASSDEQGFQIERREQASATWAQIATPGVGATSYSDVGLTPETAYCFRVLAYNENGVSPWSNESCATTEVAPPGACLDTGNHDDLSELWNVTMVGADLNPNWQATQQAGCEIQGLYFGLDSGVDSDHPDLNVIEVRNFVAAEPGHDGEDGHGHGTHTAGSATARDGNGGVVGIAPGAAVHSFRVCGDDGSCTTADIVAAIDEVTARKDATPNLPMVANMSLGGDPSAAMDEAVRRSANQGVVYAVAAGNGLLGVCLLAADAANVSPARVGDDDINASDGSDGNTQRSNGVLTTTSSTSSDGDANCNYGNPVTVAAPGVGIKSTYLNGGYNTLSGTSMATPHVAGAALLYLQEHPDATPTEVETAIVDLLAPWNSNNQPNAGGRLDVSSLH
jgi:hypothetical protein